MKIAKCLSSHICASADAFHSYLTGLSTQMDCLMLPFYQMAEQISKPLCEARKVTMVSSGDGQVGAAKLSGEVLDMMTRIPEALEKLTGVSISQVTHLRAYILHRVCVFSIPFKLSPVSCVGELTCRPCWPVVTRQTLSHCSLDLLPHS